jgi:hypothetical protein
MLVLKMADKNGCGSEFMSRFKRCGEYYSLRLTSSAGEYDIRIYIAPRTVVAARANSQWAASELDGLTPSDEHRADQKLGRRESPHARLGPTCQLPTTQQGSVAATVTQRETRAQHYVGGTRQLN